MKITTNCQTSDDLILFSTNGYIMNIFNKDFTKLYRVNTTAILKDALIYDNRHLNPVEFNDDMLIEKFKKLQKSEDTVQVTHYPVEILDTGTLMKVIIIVTESDYYHILFHKVLILVPKVLPKKLSEVQDIIEKINNISLPGGTLFAFFYWLSHNGLNFPDKRSQYNPRSYSVDVEELRMSMI